MKYIIFLAAMLVVSCGTAMSHKNNKSILCRSGKTVVLYEHSINSYAFNTNGVLTVQVDDGHMMSLSPSPGLVLECVSKESNERQ
jgi:hypothetical protein